VKSTEALFSILFRLKLQFNMKSINYFDILKKALLLTWNNKFLWVFGLIVSLGTFGSNPSMRNAENASTKEEFQFLANVMSSHQTLFMFVGGIVIFVMVVLFFLRIVATAAIIKSVGDINFYRQMGVVRIFHEARRYFWRILFFELLISFVFVCIVIILAIPTVYLFALNARLLGYFALAGMFFILVPLMILAFYIGRYGKMYIVLLDNEVKSSAEAAYFVFRKNIKESLKMGIISFGLEVFLLIAVIASILLLVLLFAPLAFASYLFSAQIGVTIIIALGSLVGITVILCLVSWYESFSQAAWVFFFQEVAFEKKEDQKKMEKVELEEGITIPEAV